MDRFFMQISSGYPNFNEEKEMLRLHRLGNPLEKIEAVIEQETIAHLQEHVKLVKISESIEDYLLNIVRATRTHDWVSNGVSPRGTLAFMRGVQAKALVNGRDYVVPEDVKAMAAPILAHRLVLSMEGELHASKERVIDAVLEHIDVPVEAGASQK
jgi:MoxR-like ATPase